MSICGYLPPTVFCKKPSFSGHGILFFFQISRAKCILNNLSTRHSCLHHLKLFLCMKYRTNLAVFVHFCISLYIYSSCLGLLVQHGCTIKELSRLAFKLDLSHQRFLRLHNLSFIFIFNASSVYRSVSSIQIFSASQAGDIQFVDIRNLQHTFLTIDAHQGSLSAFSIHRHASLIASGSTKEVIKVFNMEGHQLGNIKSYPTFISRKIGPVSCLTFHPYQVRLAAGATNPFVSIYAE